jgi:hypothetical protein
MPVGIVKDFKSVLYEAAYFKWKVTASLPVERVTAEVIVPRSERTRRLRINFQYREIS